MSVALAEIQRIPTSGARAVAPFTVEGLDLLAIPQMARDVPGTDAGMNAGDSDTELLLLRRVDGRYAPFATLPGPGGEDAEFFVIGTRSFLAVASIRSGSGPYRYDTESRIFEWRDGRFVLFQSVPTYAAKQWRHWAIGDRHFLGLAQGVSLPQVEGPDRDSVVYEWDGSSFVEFQHIPSRWAYNWHPFAVDGTTFVAHADHLDPSVLYRWDGEKLRPHQVLIERAGRAFATFTRDGAHYLVAAGLAEPPRVLRWQDDRFTEVQRLSGLGARELLVVEHGGRLFVVRVNFVLGTPHAPTTDLTSQVYEWEGDALAVVAEFPTSGGTDAAAVVDDGEDDGEVALVISNSLTADVRFATDTVVHSLVTTTGRAATAVPPADVAAVDT